MRRRKKKPRVVGHSNAANKSFQVKVNPVRPLHSKLYVKFEGKKSIQTYPVRKHGLIVQQILCPIHQRINVFWRRKLGGLLVSFAVFP
jgi:hypothetical protein